MTTAIFVLSVVSVVWSIIYITYIIITFTDSYAKLSEPVVSVTTVFLLGATLAISIMSGNILDDEKKYESTASMKSMKEEYPYLPWDKIEDGIQKEMSIVEKKLHEKHVSKLVKVDEEYKKEKESFEKERSSIEGTKVLLIFAVIALGCFGVVISFFFFLLSSKRLRKWVRVRDQLKTLDEMRELLTPTAYLYIKTEIKRYGDFNFGKYMEGNEVLKDML